MSFFFDASPNKTYLSTDLQLTTPPYYYKQHVQKSSCKNLLDAKFLRFGHSIAYLRNGEKGEKIFMKISLFSNYFVLSNLPEELPVTNFWSLANEKVVTHWHNEKSNRVLQQLTKFLIQEMKIWNNLNIFFSRNVPLLKLKKETLQKYLRMIWDSVKTEREGLF